MVSLFSILHSVLSTDICGTICSDVPNCVTSYCMDWKVPAACHGILAKSDGSFCSPTNGSEDCEGSAVRCDQMTSPSPGVTIAVSTKPSGPTTSTTTSRITAAPTIIPSFDNLRGSWCNTYVGVSPRALWVIDFLTFHENGDFLFQTRGYAFISQYYWEGNIMYIYNVRSDGLQDPGFSNMRFVYSVVGGVGELTGYWQGDSLGIFYPTGIKTRCGPVTTSFPTPSTTSTTTSGPTVTPTEDALAGTWCGQPGDTFDSIGFSGNTLAVLYNGVVHYMQYFWEGNSLYTYGADPVLESEVGMVFSALKLRYFVTNIYVVLAEGYIGTYTRDGTCAPLSGVDGVDPLTVETLPYSTWCSDGSTGMQPFEIRFTESYMTLQVFSSDYFYGWKNPVLPARYRIHSSDISLYDEDSGFKSFPELGGGNFRLVYHGSWLTLIRGDRSNLPHLKVPRC